MTDSTDTSTASNRFTGTDTREGFCEGCYGCVEPCDAHMATPLVDGQCAQDEHVIGIITAKGAFSLTPYRCRCGLMVFKDNAWRLRYET